MIRVSTFDDDIKEYITKWDGEYVFVNKWVIREMYDVSDNLFTMLCLKYEILGKASLPETGYTFLK